jgi:hypothetical protein
VSGAPRGTALARVAAMTKQRKILIAPADVEAAASAMSRRVFRSGGLTVVIWLAYRPRPGGRWLRIFARGSSSNPRTLPEYWCRCRVSYRAGRDWPQEIRTHEVAGRTL